MAQAALERQESRGGHTREDFPEMSPEWRKVNLICSLDGDQVAMARQPMAPMPTDLMALLIARNWPSTTPTRNCLPAAPARRATDG